MSYDNNQTKGQQEVEKEKDNPNNQQHHKRDGLDQDNRGEIAKNPNPRANENLTEQTEKGAPQTGPGSEITDGEDG